MEVPVGLCRERHWFNVIMYHFDHLFCILKFQMFTVEVFARFRIVSHTHIPSPLSVVSTEAGVRVVCPQSIGSVYVIP